MATCEFCLSEITDDNPAIMARRIQDAGIDWDKFKPNHYYSYTKVGDPFSIDDEVVAEVAAVKFYDGPPGWSEGELPQGTEFDAYVVLKVGENFFMVSGTGDSYDRISWDRTVRPVKAKAKTVTVYDFA